MQGFPKPWFVCGGWALDLFLGRQTREHHDIDLGIFRDDQLLLQGHFAGYNLFWVENGAKRHWGPSEYLQLPIHELRLDKNGGEVEFVLNERNETHWVYRRNPAITLPLQVAICYTTEAIPYLAPEVVLLYKSTTLSPKNQADFEATVGSLAPLQRQWLREALAKTNALHPWRLDT